MCFILALFSGDVLYIAAWVSWAYTKCGGDVQIYFAIVTLYDL